MEIDKLTEKLKVQTLWCIGIVFFHLILSEAILLCCLFKADLKIVETIVFSVLIVLLLSFSAVLMWICRIQLKQILELQFQETEKKRKQALETDQAEKNQVYRLEALKWERLHQIVKEISEKKETTTKNDEGAKKVVKTLLNTELISIITQLKSEIEKIK